MYRQLAGLLLSACASAPPARPPVVENTAAAPAPLPTSKDFIQAFTVDRVAKSTSAPSSVHGTILAGTPLGGATVVFETAGVAPRIELTDERGRFAIDGFTPGVYTFSIYYDDQAGQRVLDVRDSEIVVLDIRWARPASNSAR